MRPHKQERLPLVYEDEQQAHSTLHRLNTLRKEKQLCDVILEVEGHNIPAHRAVLGCLSAYLFELFSEEEENSTNEKTHFRLDDLFDYETFELLVDYAYTAKLEVPAQNVKTVYKAATLLKMGNAARACCQYLADHLTPLNCIGTRAFANSHSDAILTEQTDSYIQQNIEEIVKTGGIQSLPTVLVNIMGVSAEDLKKSGCKLLCQLVVDWSERVIDDQYTLENLREDPHWLYLTRDNILRDCVDLDDENLTHTELIKDYKNSRKNKMTPKLSGGKSKMDTKFRSSPPQNSSRSLRSSTESLVQEKEWKVIATHPLGDLGCLCIAMLEDQLASISIKFRPLPSTNNDGASSNGTTSPVNISPRNSLSLDKQCSLTPLARMSTPRCALGTAVLTNGDIVAVGGYDRGDCFNTMEKYSLARNTWEPQAPMSQQRARFYVSELKGKLVACGGSNGTHELKSVESYDPEENKWSSLPDMQICRSYAGAAVLNGKLYVVGGWNGSSGLKNCEVYDPETNSWESTASLQIGRSQAAVCAFHNTIVAIGGVDNWNCLNSVERYDPVENKWTFLPNMNSSRRGAGAAFFNGKLHVVGGSDGQHSMETTEMYDEANQTWKPTTPLCVPRANVGLSVSKNRMFAIGGFSGKLFLESMEYLGAEAEEWCGLLPVDPIEERENGDGERYTNGDNVFGENGEVGNGSCAEVVANGHGDAFSEARPCIALKS